MSYYNTLSLEGDELSTKIAKCQNQESKVLVLAKALKKPFSASQLFNLWPGNNTPITSIRRAITNLKNKQILERTQDTVTGMYGDPEHLYKLLN